MRIICFGDSLTACGGPNGRFSDILQDRFPGHDFINRGVNGDTLERAGKRWRPDVLDLQPDIVVIELGANDWQRQERPPAAWAADLEALVQSGQKTGIRIIIASIFGPCRDPQIRAQRLADPATPQALDYLCREQAIASNYGCDYVANLQMEILGDRTCWSDASHPNEHGNRQVADQLQPILEKRLGQKALPIRTTPFHTLRDFWNEAVALAGPRLAAAGDGRRLTYAEADALAGQLAAGLIRAGGQTRPKIAVALPNRIEYFLIYWAVVKIGGIIVPLNTWLRQESLEAIYETVDPDLLIVLGKTDTEVLAAAAKRPGLPVFALQPESGHSDFASLLDNDGQLPAVAIAADDPAIIMHTSGTTAAPKGAVMRHSDLIFNVMTTINAQDFTEEDVHLLVNPMFHCTALYSSLPAAACQKTPVIITADTSPEGLLKLIEAERITTFLTVPSILQRVTALPTVREFKTASLRVIGYAGSFMPTKTVRDLQSLFPGVRLHNFFGLTETISATHCMNSDDGRDLPDSIGQLLPFVEAIIVDEARHPVPAGTVGELLFARENVISGYWNKPGKLEEALVEIAGRQWFNTGDLALVDADGYFFIKGRKKDMIIVGGENVYAAEVEGALLRCPGVREAAVKGIPATGVRESLGELIKAYIVRAEPKLTEMDLRRHCHQCLPSYKIPHFFIFLDALPRNPAGKVVKDELP
jgi:fatty-acyl-CoA synthase